MNPFEKKSKKRTNAVAKFRNKRPLDGGKKKRFQLLNSSDTEFDITYDNDALGQLSNKEAVDQTTGSEFAQDTLYRTKKEVMAEVISKSKQFKAEKKQEKYIVETLIEDIDAEFMTLSLKDSQVDGNKNPFERTRELHTILLEIYPC
ncbi:hypothetical protein Gasu2_11580 [Galdieria sulphuraria]|nr:hypothetical protein Gasu2_11580 [Galdieria sulphuraria]